jgi:hypothetical protein
VQATRYWNILYQQRSNQMIRKPNMFTSLGANKKHKRIKLALNTSKLIDQSIYLHDLELLYLCNTYMALTASVA